MWSLGQHIDPDENPGGDSKTVSQAAPTAPCMHTSYKYTKHITQIT